MHATDISAEQSAALIRQAQGGDLRAFKAWLTAEYDFIYRLSWRLMGNKLDAEDLTQSICLAMPQKIETYSGRGSVHGWLARVVLNSAKDQWRKQGRVRTIPFEEDMVEASSLSPSDHHTYLAQVLKMMEKLPEKSRLALLLAAEGLDTAEMAKALNCTMGTAGWRLSTARAELQKLLHTEGGTHYGTAPQV
jgi:RNA polymerase sigma-70 factor (ECF subfamily)